MLGLNPADGSQQVADDVDSVAAVVDKSSAARYRRIARPARFHIYPATESDLGENHLTDDSAVGKLPCFAHIFHKPELGSHREIASGLFCDLDHLGRIDGVDGERLLAQNMSA